MNRIHQLAKKLSHERVPETCPAVHTAGVAAIAKFLHWASSKTRWFGRMTRSERHQFEIQVGELVAEVLEGAKENGTRILREAHAREIEDYLRMSLTAERIARVEAGEDLNVTELFPDWPALVSVAPSNGV